MFDPCVKYYFNDSSDDCDKESIKYLGTFIEYVDFSCGSELIHEAEAKFENGLVLTPLRSLRENARGNGAIPLTNCSKLSDLSVEWCKGHYNKIMKIGDPTEDPHSIYSYFEYIYNNLMGIKEKTS